jgi:hypothetical protein
MSIETNFVPYQIALDMKLLGFDEPCFTYYGNISACLFGLKGDIKFHTNTLLDIVHGENVVSSAPLYSQAFKFFRDKYNLYYSINPLGYNMCLGSVGELGSLKSVNADVNAPYGNYQEAELACLVALIEIVKKNK